MLEIRPLVEGREGACLGTGDRWVCATGHLPPLHLPQVGGSLADEAALQQPEVTLGLLADILAESARAAAALTHLQYAATD